MIHAETRVLIMEISLRRIFPNGRRPHVADAVPNHGATSLFKHNNLLQRQMTQLEGDAPPRWVRLRDDLTVLEFTRHSE